MPGVLFIQPPGVRAEALTRLLRAVFCFREDIPSAGERETFASLPLPECLSGDESALAGSFQDAFSLPIRYPNLARSWEVFRIAAVDDPLRVQARVYAHMVKSDPGLPERRPARFSTLEHFLAVRRDPIASSLAAALGRRRIAPGDFDAVAGEASGPLTELAARLAEWTHDPRARVLLRALAERPGDPRGAPDDSAPEDFGVNAKAAREFRRRNSADYALFEVSRRLDAQRRRRRPFFRRRPISSVPAAADEPAFVFNHLPKCYGSSLRVLLAGGFAMVEDHTRFQGVEGIVRDAPIRTGSLAADTILAGHLCQGDFLLQRRYPGIWEDPRFRLFTYLRDPLDTALSNYLHVTERYPEVAEADPELFASPDEYVRRMCNPIAARLGCDGRNLDEVLGRYFFIGIAERHRESLPILLGAMERVLVSSPQTATVRRARAVIPALRRHSLPHENPRRTRTPLREALSRETLEIFTRRNALDLAIYRRIEASAGVGP